MAKSPKDEKPADAKLDAEADTPQSEDAIEDAEVIEEIPAESEDTAPVELEEPEAESDAAPDEESDEKAEEPTEEAPDAESESTEPVTEPEPEEKPKPAASVAKPKSSGGGFIGLLLGGVIAGAIGFGAGQYVNGGWPFEPAPVEDPLATDIADQAARIVELTDRIAAQEAAMATVQSDTSVDALGASLRADIVETQARIEAAMALASTLDERITVLEKMPQGDSAEAANAAAEAYERELAAMRTMLEREIADLQAMQSDAETLQVSAAEAAKAAAGRAAMARIMAALESGQPFADALFDLKTATGLEIPDGLAAVSQDGVPTLARLQADFPDAARAALDASIRAMVETGEIGRGEAFMRIQLGTRSLEPREGDDPDAVLSRAEFALKSGQIGAALTELADMPEAGQPALADWIALATTRADALEAGAALAQDLNK